MCIRQLSTVRLWRITTPYSLIYRVCRDSNQCQAARPVRGTGRIKTRPPTSLQKSHTPITLPMRKICASLPAVALISGGIVLSASAVPAGAVHAGAGDRRSRRSAARSPPLLLPGAPTSCWPRWQQPTWPAWTTRTRTCWRSSMLTHVRAYQGGRKVAKTHLSRLKFPAPATVETWVSDASGDPVLVVMAAPGASLVMELRRLLPDLRRAVGDDRRVLVGFDRGGWSPALFEHMDAEGFDVLTWRKGLAEDVDPTLFTDAAWLDETGRTHQWRVADTTVDLPVGDNNEVFTMRQVTLLVANNKTGRQEHAAASTRQIHILTTRGDLPVEQVIYRMGSRWRQENYFRYARMHFDLDSHDAYATTQDDPTRMVPNPAKKKVHKQLLATRARYDRALAATDAALLEAVSPPPGQAVLITNADHDRLTTDLRDAEAALDTAQHAHRAAAARLPLAQVNPGQQVLDIQTKLISHAIRIAAFNTATALARDVRT